MNNPAQQGGIIRLKLTSTDWRVVSRHEVVYHAGYSW